MTARDDDTDDCAFLGGKLVLRQMRSGHRAGTDACLLAAALDVRPGECVADVGAGVGAVGLAILARCPGTQVLLIEREPQSCVLARHNASANGFADRAQVVEAHALDESATVMGLQACADVVVSNPPYYDQRHVRVSPDAARAAAHVLRDTTLAGWLRAMVRLARPRGRLALIHRPEAVPSLLRSWPAGWGGINLRWVHAFADRPAVRCLITAKAGSRAPMTVGSPLILHDPSGRFLPEAELIHQGGRDIHPNKKAG